MTKDSPLYRRGRELLETLHGGHAGEAMVAELEDVCPAFADMSIEWALGGVMARPGLDLLTRELILVAACATLGHAQLQLKAHAAAARSLGATREQLVEAVLQLTFYAGGPAVRAALTSLREVFSADPA